MRCLSSTTIAFARYGRATRLASAASSLLPVDGYARPAHHGLAARRRDRHVLLGNLRVLHYHPRCRRDGYVLQYEVLDRALRQAHDGRRALSSCRRYILNRDVVELRRVLGYGL